MDNGTATLVFPTDLTPQQRAAKITRLLAQGGVFTNRQIADMFGVTIQAATQMMDNLSSAIPIDKETVPGGRWYDMLHNGKVVRHYPGDKNRWLTFDNR